MEADDIDWVCLLKIAWDHDAQPVKIIRPLMLQDYAAQRPLEGPTSANSVSQERWRYESTSPPRAYDSPMALWFCVFLTLPRSTCPTFPTTESRENTRPVGNFDSFYSAKAAALNKAVQDIGMGRYQW